MMRRFILAAGITVTALGLAGNPAGATARVSHDTAAATKQQTMYVTISGPREVQTWWSCTWTVYVQGGTPPYTYHWGTTGMYENYSSGTTWNGYAAVGGSVGLNVLVTDANNQSAWGSLVIDSSNAAPFCME